MLTIISLRYFREGGSALEYIGLILELNDTNAVVITKDCRYFQIKRCSDMFAGQKVEFTKADIIDVRCTKVQGGIGLLQRKYKYVAVAFAFIIFISAIFMLNTYLNSKNDIYAYIDIDINPSLEIAIDSQNKIREVHPLNDDAKTLIDGLKLKKVLLKDALTIIVSKSKEYGFVNENEKNIILISAVINEQKTGSENVNKLINDIYNYVKELSGINISVKVVNVEPEVRKLASHNNISVGRYVVYEEAKKAGLDISIESVRETPLETILDKIELEGVEVNELPNIAVESPKIISSTPTNGLKTPVPAKNSLFPLVPSNAPQSSSEDPLETRLQPATPIAGSTPISTVTSSPVITPTVIQTNVPANITPTANPVEEIIVSGLKGEYYNNLDFTELKMLRTDHEVNFIWNEASPDPLLDSETFSIRWTGKIVPEFSESYTFYTYADDGVRLWVNNVLLIDDWVKHFPRENSGTINLTAGTQYDIKLEYFENKGNAQVKLYWSSESQEKEIIPSKQYRRSANVYQAEKATFSKGIVEDIHSNFTGSGYINYNKESGSYVEWVVTVNKSALYTLNFKYANASSLNRPLEIKVNNSVIVDAMNFNSTGAWNAWQNNSITVRLNSGINIIRATATTNEGGPNVDYLELLTP